MSDQPNLQHLIPAIVRGEEEAFAELLDVAGPRLRRAAIRMLGSESDADDAIQELFVGLVKSRRRIARVENVNAYLFVSLHRVVYKLLAKRSKQPGEGTDLDEVADESRAIRFDGDDLSQAVAELPESQRIVISLKTDAQLTYSEIGELLGISPNTAASRYRYGLESLRKLLKEEPY